MSSDAFVGIDPAALERECTSRPLNEQLEDHGARKLEPRRRGSGEASAGSTRGAMSRGHVK
jgi:hypothetical protein